MKLHRFESFGEFENAVVDVDLKVRLLGPQDGPWRIGHADIDGFTVQRGIEVVPNLCEASGWPTHLMFLLSPGRPTPTWLNGVPFSNGKVGVLAPGRGFVFRAAGPNEWTTIAVPLTSWLLHMDNETGQALRGWCQSTCMLDATPSAIEALERAALIAANPHTPRSTRRALIENAIVGLVCSRTPQSMATGRPGVSPHAICDATLNIFDLMDKTGHDQLDGLPMGARSLRTFFHNCFGRGPVQYLQLRQLHAIHEALQHAHDDWTSVADTFERHGYAYSSYALARYRAVFGETPSTTRVREITGT